MTTRRLRSTARYVWRPKKREIGGLFLDLTLSSGWPFGGGEVITPELASIELRFTRKVLSGASHFRDRIELPAPRSTAGMNLAHMFWFDLGRIASGMARATARAHPSGRDRGYAWD